MFASLIRRRVVVSSLPRRFKSAQALPKDVATPAADDVTTAVPIGACLAAAFAGVTTVSVAAAAVEFATAPSVPAFDPSSQRYSQETFQGRFCRMLLACDPRLLLYSSEQVQQAKVLVDKYDNYKDDRSMDRALWEARRVAESALHPDTGEVIPHPFRMSGYVPFNGPICVAMVASKSTLPLLFWSWVNQSQNALVNYYNRNASSPMSNETLMISYSAAVGSALTVAFGLATVLQKRYPPAQAAKLMKWVAFPSAVVASSLNCYIVRSPEIETGISLYNDRMEVVSSDLTSQEAARRGVNSTTLSRAILQAPVYFLPPLLLTTGPLKRYILKYPATCVPLTTYLLLTSFGIGLPVTIAIFPQFETIVAEDVESKFQHLRDAQSNAPYKVYYYNKGL